MISMFFLLVHYVAFLILFVLQPYFNVNFTAVETCQGKGKHLLPKLCLMKKNSEIYSKKEDKMILFEINAGTDQIWRE